jgi:hypothetical protein
VNGTFCRGKFQESWQRKMLVCRTCDVFLEMIPTDI